MFDIVYYQIYASNVDGIIAGATPWSRYLGDRQFGWLGSRPICDTLLKLNGLDARTRWTARRARPWAS